MSKHELGADRVFHEGAGYSPCAGKAHSVRGGSASMRININHKLIDQNHKSGIM